jgi:hypothetical protein
MVHQHNNLKGINSLSWLMVGEILLFRIETPLKIGMFVYDQMIVDQLDETPYPVHIVVQISELPLQEGVLEDLMQLNALQHPHLGFVALIGTMNSTQGLPMDLSDGKQVNVKQFGTLDDAVKYLSRAKMKYLAGGTHGLETPLR